jgi:hypothetical protein
MIKQKEKQSLTQEENQILISFVNHHFGPVRGLNFIIKGERKIEIKEYLENQPQEVISEIWKSTLLSTRAMELPMKLVEELESKPKVVESIEEGEKAIMENVYKGNLTGDPFFFRSFIL